MPEYEYGGDGTLSNRHQAAIITALDVAAWMYDQWALELREGYTVTNFEYNEVAA